MGRWVAHIDMDAFFSSVEQLTRPTLRSRPVLVGGGAGRGVVAGASYEARVFGARSAMPMHQAQQLCRGKAVVVRPRHGLYSMVSEQIFAVLGEHAEVLEPVSIDEAFAVVATETPQQWAEMLRQQVFERTQLSCSVGVASTKLDAKLASEMAKPAGVQVIDPQHRLELLGGKPVGDVWGIGKVTQARLHEVGVERINEFAAMDERDVRQLLGNVGVEIQRMVQGKDAREVAPRGPAKQISSERTFAQDIALYAELVGHIAAAAQDVHRRLLNDGRAAKTITLKTKTSDFVVHSKSVTLPVATDDLETIRSQAIALAPRPESSGAIRLVGVGLSGLVTDRQQILFPELDRPAVAEVVEMPASRGVTVGEAGDRWWPTQDVHHETLGHGWIQGVGERWMTVRFETRQSGPGKAVTLSIDDPNVRACTPEDSY